MHIVQLSVLTKLFPSVYLVTECMGGKIKGQIASILRIGASNQYNAFRPSCFTSVISLLNGRTMEQLPDTTLLDVCVQL